MDKLKKILPPEKFNYEATKKRLDRERYIEKYNYLVDRINYEIENCPYPVMNINGNLLNNIDETAVWNFIKKLNELGYSVMLDTDSYTAYLGVAIKPFPKVKWYERLFCWNRRIYNSTTLADKLDLLLKI
jgi:hypothetical protein